MSSIVSDFEYDVFISYRQKDNRYDGWVTEFVSNLKRELEATFREEISVYFDLNPVDGLQENHVVDDSLRDKLRCLIFIPVISWTYCDPKSFAWNYEFRAFIEMASKDEFGLRVKLPNGNVANRILPVRIYDLGSRNVELCEELTGGPLRGIEFIYRSTGVNRPLRANEDHPGDNAGKTYYRDQINKVANSIRETLDALATYKKKENTEHPGVHSPRSESKVRKNNRIIAGSILLVAILLTGIVLVSGVLKSSSGVIEKSIAVLPFVNRSSDAEQDYLADGMVEEIVNRLYMVGEINTPAFSSTSIYRGSKLSNREIARQLKVAYLLVGSINKSGNNIKIFVNLIEGKTGKIKWTDNYSRIVNAANYFEIQSDIASNVAKSLEVALDHSVQERISSKPTQNDEAYDLYLQAISTSANGIDYSEVEGLLEKAISLDPNFADAYAELGYWWLHQGGYGGTISREEVFKEATPLLSKALEIDSTCVAAHYSNALLKLYYDWDFKTVGQEYNTVKRLAPSNHSLISFFTDYLISAGKPHEAFIVARDAFTDNPESADNYISMALTTFFDNQAKKAPDYLSRALTIYPAHENLVVNSMRLYNYMGMYNETIRLYKEKLAENVIKKDVPYIRGHYGIALYKTGNNKLADSILRNLSDESRRSSIGSPAYFTAAIYTAMGQDEKALDLLENAFDRKEVEMYWLRVEPLFGSLHGNPRFEKILSGIGYN